MEITIPLIELYGTTYIDVDYEMVGKKVKVYFSNFSSLLEIKAININGDIISSIDPVENNVFTIPEGTYKLSFYSWGDDYYSSTLYEIEVVNE